MGRGGPDHEAAELLAGNEDVRLRAAALLGRALGGIPEQARAAAARHDRLRMRADAGYFTAELAHTAVEHGCDFAIAAKRNTAMWRAYVGVGQDAWLDGKDMPGRKSPRSTTRPAGWPEAGYTIIRRVRVDAEAISADPEPGDGAPSTPTRSRWRWKAPRPTPTRSPSSSPTSPPMTR